MTEKTKKSGYPIWSATVETKKGEVYLEDDWFYPNNLRGMVVKALEKMNPKDRKKVKLYCNGKLVETLFWQDYPYGSGYFIDIKGGARWSIFKNGNMDRFIKRV